METFQTKVNVGRVWTSLTGSASCVRVCACMNTCACLFVKHYQFLGFFFLACVSECLLDVINPSPAQQQEIYKE